MERKIVDVKVKKLNKLAVIPVYAHDTDAGFDLVSVETVLLQPGESTIVPTGLAMQLPNTHELQVRPRSGISSKTMIRVANAPGTVDAGYRGEVGVILTNTRQREYAVSYAHNGLVSDVVDAYSEEVYGVDGKLADLTGTIFEQGFYPVGSILIKKGDKIAQGVLNEVPKARFTEVDDLDDSDRGGTGFGDSGFSVKSEAVAV